MSSSSSSKYSSESQREQYMVEDSKSRRSKFKVFQRAVRRGVSHKLGQYKKQLAKVRLGSAAVVAVDGRSDGEAIRDII